MSVVSPAIAMITLRGPAGLIFAGGARSVDQMWQHVSTPRDAFLLRNVAPNVSPFKSISVRRRKGSGVRYKLALKTLPISLSALPVASGSEVHTTLEIVRGPKTGVCYEQVVRCRLKRGQKHICRP